MTKFSAILATGRISNLPTVWCNVLVAFLLVRLTAFKYPKYYIDALSVSLLIAAVIAASCLYVGGCFLGDAVDVEFDRKHKPNRPIPSGVINRSTIYTWASFLISSGIVIPTAFIYLSIGSISLVALSASLSLTAAIIIYSLWHKRSPWIGLPFIAACRFFLILFGAYVAASTMPTFQENFGGNELHNDDSSSWKIIYGAVSVSPLTYLYALAVGTFTICFASVASSESSPKPITWRKALISIMLFIPLVATLHGYRPVGFPIDDTYYTLIEFRYIVIAAILIYYIWMITAFKQINTNKGKFVSMSLAGFCLLDACFAAAFGWQWLLVCLVLFALSLFLQKFAPAT